MNRRDASPTRPSLGPSLPSKTKLEGLFVDELALLQPTAGYMRLVKDGRRPLF